jgi:hypothetical protein
MDDVVMGLEREAGMAEHVPQIGVGFCLYPLKDDAESEKNGREIFRDVEFVKIIVPGDRESVVFQPATAEHKRRFPLAYRRFKEQEQVAQEGTPIEAWPAIGRGLALTLKAAGIPTVEALANVHDGNLDKLGHGIRELRAKAQGFIAQASNAAAAQTLAKEKQQLLDVIANLQAQVRELAELQGVNPDELESAPGKAKPKKAKAKRKAA